MTTSTDVPGGAAPLRRSPLHARHAALGAKTADFGGWDMPIEYADGGVVAEHTAVRTDVGVFDVSHLGKLLVRGPGARAALNALFSNDLDRIVAGQAQYTLCLDESGGIVDDLLVYVRSDDDLLLVPNAANSAAVAEAVRVALPDGVTMHDAHSELAVIAVQGPRSTAVLDELGLPTGLDYMAFVDARWGGTDAVVCRSGYSGELGYEVLVPGETATALWDAVLERGARPCGLGARDTLRTEMGYPLHGNELSVAVTPVEARLGWAVGWDKPAFRGRDAVVARRAEGASRRLLGLKATGRGIPRPGMDVLVSDEGGASGESRPVGVTTSGTFSPTLRTGIALAMLDQAVEPGDLVEVDVRGRRLPFEVVRPPFVQSNVR